MSEQQLHQNISDFLDGDLEDAERLHLADRLEADGDSAEVLDQLLSIESLLVAAHQPQRDTAEVVRAIQRRARTRIDFWRPLKFAAAAAIAMGLLLLFTSGGGNHKVVAGKVTVDGVETSVVRDGQTVEVISDIAAELTLRDGSQMTMEPGSAGIIHGTQGEVRQVVEVLRGRNSFHVETGERQFKVKTNVGSVTVLGTEFSVEKTGDAADNAMVVAVTSGRVEVAVLGTTHILNGGDRRVFGVGPATSPPNGAAKVSWDQKTGHLRLRYHGRTIFEGTVEARRVADGQVVKTEIALENAEHHGDKFEQRLIIGPVMPMRGVELVLRGKSHGSDEAFASETRSDAQMRFPLVRNSVGLSRNLRNNAVYDRKFDWVLSDPTEGRTRINPMRTDSGRVTFDWTSRGGKLELVFKPLLYQKHKGATYFEPWKYQIKRKSVAGYNSWWAYRTQFDQETLDAMIDVFKQKHLPDFGYDTFQIDNSFNTRNGSPEGWLNWNKKFPGGPDYAIRKIRGARMKPGIFLHRVFKTNDKVIQKLVADHPDWFIRKSDGQLEVRNGFYAINTMNADAVDRLIRPTFRGLKKQGWEYFKIEGDRSLLDHYERNPEHLGKIGATPEQLLRRWDQIIREELGTGPYVMGAFGAKSGLATVGLTDGVRMSGTTGFSASGFQRFNSWNGVVWRNDPDHCDILPPDGAKATMTVFGAQAAPVESIMRPSVASMAGGVLMVSDKVDVYKNDQNLEGMKRSAPILSTVPGQLYDYTARSSGNLFVNRNGDEAPWWMLEIDRPFDHWSVLARFNWASSGSRTRLPAIAKQEIQFADLGLEADEEFLVFEFWRQKFIGKFRGSFIAPPMSSNNGLQVFAIRKVRTHPWILSTTRHLSQGAVSLHEVKWDEGKNVLSGRSDLIKADPYVLTIHLPKGFELTSADAGDEKVKIEKHANGIAAIRINPTTTKTVGWSIRFNRVRD